MTQPIHSSHPSTVRISAGFTFLVLPFYINDFSSIFIQDWRWWLGIDYVLVKLVPLAGAAWLIRTGQFSRQELGFKSQGVMTFITWTLGLTLICTLIDQNAYTLTADLPGHPPLGGMPAITSPFWDWFDLTLGLALVALCEELVFRGYLCRFQVNGAAAGYDHYHVIYSLWVGPLVPGPSRRPHHRFYRSCAHDRLHADWFSIRHDAGPFFSQLH